MPISKQQADLQAKSLFLSGNPVVKTFSQAKKFMEAVGICLRYWPTKGLPLASAYRASMGDDPKEIGQPRAIDLTNQLLAAFEVVEVNVIADRICLVHHSLMPALHRLVTRGEDRTSKLSRNAKRTLELIEETEQVTAGDVRKSLGLAMNLKEDPAYLALAELQRCLLIDRGPFRRPAKGIPYLPKEGYPYHLFSEAHGDMLKSSARLSIPVAADRFILGYLGGARFGSLKKLGTMFKLFLSPNEIAASIDRLASEGNLKTEKKGSDVLAILKK